HLRFDEIPGFREIAVPDPVPFPDRAALRDIHLVQEVHLLELVDVAVDRRLRGLQLRGELLDGPPLVETTEQTFDEQTVWDGVAHGARVGLRIVAFRDVSDLREEQEGDIVNVLQRREGGVADDVDLERQAGPPSLRDGGGLDKASPCSLCVILIYIMLLLDIYMY